MVLRKAHDCLPADVLKRIEEYERKARTVRGGSATRPGVYAGRKEGKTRAIPAEREECLAGNVIAFCMSRPKRRNAHHGRPAVVLRFDLDMRKREDRHARSSIF